MGVVLIASWVSENFLNKKNVLTLSIKEGRTHLKKKKKRKNKRPHTLSNQNVLQFFFIQSLFFILIHF